MNTNETNKNTSNPVKVPWFLSTWFIILVFAITFIFAFGIPAIILAVVRFVKYKENRGGSRILMCITIAIPSLLIALGILDVIMIEHTENGVQEEAQKEPKEEEAAQKEPENKQEQAAITVQEEENSEEQAAIATREKENPEEQAAIDAQERENSEEQAENNKEEYIFPDSNSRYLSEEEVRSVDADKLKIARNEVFARHGYIFNDEELNQYFNNVSWYQGTVRSDQFNMEWVLNDFEKKNVELISLVEKSSKKSTGETLLDVDVVGGYANITEIAENLIENNENIVGQKVAFCGWGFYHDSDRIELRYFEGENDQALVTAYYDPEKMPTMGNVEPFDMATTIVWGTVRGISDDHGIEIDLDAVNVSEQNLWFVEFYAEEYREVFDAYEAKAADWGGKLTMEGTVQAENGQKHILVLDNGDECTLWGGTSEELSSIGENAIYDSFDGLRVKVYGILADASPMISVDYITPIVQ